ncbi:hypothetical protein [Paraburkholderia gardini]|uniref:hypothetical protein n=1 Tax=Paraburkholderia gardini TaxID=2823469 RepID=UPI001D9D90CF|nr:hypothetical protein [Paraburkholderia gardini]CAG4923460.1 hypothetical protein R69919_05105 [Paraburkholderia gardini]
MKRRYGALGAMAFTVAIAAHAQAATKAQELDVAWFKDGHQIVAARQVINSDEIGPNPLLYSSGEQVPSARCIGGGNNVKLKGELVFVGRSLFVQPVAVHGDKARLLVSAMDTTSDGTRQTGPADCRSLVVDVHGLSEKDISVDISVGQSVDVPMKDAHYRLVLKLNDASM